MITSTRNAHVQRARKLLRRGLREKTGEFLIEGLNSVVEAMAARLPLQLVFVQKGTAGAQIPDVSAKRAPFFEVSEAVMSSISDTSTPQGIVAVSRFIDKPWRKVLEGVRGLCVVLADVRDPGNAGTILRAALAAGAEAVFVGKGTVDVYNPKCVRAAAGTLFNIPFSREVELPSLLDELGKRGMRRLAADSSEGHPYYEVDMKRPTALILGNEAWGLPRELKWHIDERVHIPMSEKAESLNVAMAATVLLFEHARQTRT